MSLLFDHAIDTFDPASATLHSVGGELNSITDPVPVRPVADFASHHDTLRHPEKDWICIPLHPEDSAEHTDEYVAYTDHDLHGPIFIFNQDGNKEFLDPDAFATTHLAHHIRFWHSDYLPDTRPDTYDSPIDDHEEPRNPTDSGKLLNDFEAYVAEERAATRDTNREQAQSLSPELSYQEGRAAIPSLSCQGDNGDGQYHFRVDLPSNLKDRRNGDWSFFIEQEFDIHAGNEVLLHAPANPSVPDAFPIKAEVVKIRGLNLWLSVDWSALEKTAAIGGDLTSRHADFGLSVLLNPIPFDREATAVETMRDHSFREVLSGERSITFSNAAEAESDPFDTDLNQEQQSAVEHALLADDLFCIHGPPGTGKSRTLVEIIRRAVQAGEEVLVCADSNQAVDNLVAGTSTVDNPDPESLHAHSQHCGDEFKLDRVNASRSSSTVVRQEYSDVPGKADVVAATNSSAGTLARDFDLLVVDEATQATCTATCIPLTSADRVVLAGDHRQLPPYSTTESPPDSSAGLSLFEHLYADEGIYEGVGLQLRTQYRMHREIVHFPNRRFYDQSLRNGQTVSSLGNHQPVEGYNLGGNVESVETSRKNHNEARMVVYLVNDLLENVPASEIGVITPYSAQVVEIQSLLQEECEDADKITIDTIDSFQGSERTAIVISLVRSNANGEIGFLGRAEDGPRRLNVALTRAQKYCAVIADWDTLRYEAEGKYTDLYRDFYTHYEETGRLNNVEPEFIPV
jgi:hypothetical protein